MRLPVLAINLLALATMPIVILGVINRVKARWSGRRGAPILQLAFDLMRLVRKRSVYGHTTTAVFRLAPVVVLVTAVASACIVPLAGWAPIASFPFDFVWFAYVWGLGRVAIMLGALDTGSSFEGMGAAREATFGALIEPVIFLVIGAMCLLTGARSLHGVLEFAVVGRIDTAAHLATVAALLIVLQVEAARVPIDDPTTHLELTMVHEVMVLDHSGRELAMLQLGAAIKLYVAISIVASILNPWSGAPDGRGAVGHVAISLAIAAGIGLAESLVARLRLRNVPHYIAVALVASGVALFAVLAANA